ncbi:hypothetical protein [Luteimonas sp. MC1572]|uniref:hypothetical protein n=1 Tax=Luteimonas sp. MC1572 TaxID=2799325 RepID=UPI0018F0896A|nr:hypothetical protein [Luteimonas sp. MC1572]MBJ6981372.1 hypothetical protein [Luteimonas sp. MC1572]QQO02685.1 hypothetical protein JGR64_10965 [Luteimonas sp. MC1572]
MTRWKAAGSHLALSLLVIGGIAITAFLLWYPHGLYKVAGLDRILLVMLGIDLTAGPLLTLILYKPGKWGLKFDLIMVAIAQLAFLGYGLHTLWGGRPVFLVGTPETFTVVFANEIADEDLAKASRPEWRRLSWTGPVLVGTRMPTEPEQRHAVIEEFMAGGAGIERTPKYYMPFKDVAGQILEAAERAPGAVDPARLMPVVSRRGEGQLLIDPSTALPDWVVTRDNGKSR